MKGYAVVFGFVVAAALSQSGHAGKRDYDQLVKVTTKASQVGADGKQTVAFTFAIEKGWYIYANPVGDKEYAENRTTIVITANEKVTTEVHYPATQRTNKYKHRVYENEVVINAIVQRTVGDTGPLQAKIDINVNVCSHEGLCLPTRTIKLTIP